MPRRKLYRRSVPIPDAEATEKYLLTLPRRELYAHPESMPCLTSTNLFGNDRPIELEIGSGGGEFLLSLAERHPGTNYVGVEIRHKSIHEAIMSASVMALENIRFVHTDARLIFPLLDTGSLRAVYLHFPDPVTRPKFRNRRLFTERFLDAMHEALTCDGRLSVMTDHAEVFEEMLLLAEADARWRRTHRERYLVGYEIGAKSRFQRLWEGHGLPTLRFELVKRCERPEPGVAP